MELSPDTLLRNRYRIMRLLGKGGMGAVYLAYDTSLENQVAVKLNHSISAHAAQQFLREAQLLAMLRHPNLPRVSDYFVEQDTQCLVMDYIPGEDLSQMLDKYTRLPLQDVLRWAEQMGSALDYMHRQTPPVVHRDIKPGNIKLTAEGEAILVDFGIAKASDASQATATGAVGYTPGFAPPEQYGSGHTGPFSDQYALAATLYTLLTGSKPVDSVQRVLGQAVLTPPGAINPELPRGVCAALEKALNLRPNERYANILDFANALMAGAQDSAYMSGATTAAQALPTMQAASVNTVAAGRTAPQPGGAPPTAGWAGAPMTAAAPRRRGWLLPVLLVGVLALVAVVAIAVLPGLAAPPPATPTWTLPPPQDTATSAPSLTFTPVNTATASQTPTPSLTATPQATVTPSLTDTPQASPTFTPQPIGQGGVLAFVSDRDGSYQIWTMRVYLDTTGHVKAGDLQQLTSGGGDKFFPAWSPDGRYLLYSMDAGIDEKGDDLGLDLWIMDVSQPEAPAVDITRQRGDDTYADWASDGTLIAYTNDGRSDKVPQVYVIQPDGQNRKRMSFDLREFQPSWSPDMTRLVFMTFINNNNIIYWRRDYEDFATPGPFDNQRLSERTGQSAEPVYSPDGIFLAYVQMRGRNNNICTVEAATRGGDVFCLTTTNKESNPNWAPDSQWIVFASERDGNKEIYVMTLAGLLQTNLTNDPAEDMQPAWQP